MNFFWPPFWEVIFGRLFIQYHSTSCPMNWVRQIKAVGRGVGGARV